MTDERPLDLRSQAERIASEIRERGGFAMRHEGEWIVDTRDANRILGKGGRYLRNLRNEGRAPRSIQLTNIGSRSAHHYYRIIDLLGMWRVEESGFNYFQKAS